MKSNEKDQFISVICQHVDSVYKLWSFHIQMKIVSASDFKLGGAIEVCIFTLITFSFFINLNPLKLTQEIKCV